MYSETKSDRFLGRQRDSDGFKKVSHVGKCCFALDCVLKSENFKSWEIAESLFTFVQAQAVEQQISSQEKMVDNSNQLIIILWIHRSHVADLKIDLIMSRCTYSNTYSNKIDVALQNKFHWHLLL